jgi:hypothetical protein
MNPPNPPNPETFIQYQPHYHCPQCDGAIDQRCVTVSALPIDYANLRPRRLVDAWCDFCSIAWRATTELDGQGYRCVSAERLHGDAAQRIRRHAESQTSVIRRRKAS